MAFGPCDPSPAKGPSSPSWSPSRKWSNVPWIVVITLLPVWVTSAVRVDEQRLLDALMADYNTAARPVYNASQTVTVKFGLTLTQISDMDEVNQVLTINVWLEQEWEDERLVWDPQDYNGLEILRIPCEKIWLPDIVLYNSADDFTTGYMKSKAMVTYTGNVFWPPPAKFRSSCKIDITYFPFDDQVCELKFGSWTYDGFQVDITNRSAKVDLTNYVFSGEWELIDVRVRRTEMYYACCDMPYPDVRFTIIIRRKTLYYLFNIIFPCLWLTILSLLGFWLPPDSGEKITLGITVLLAFSVFMLLIAESMPATSEFVPLIGIYLTVTMAMTSMSIILTVFVLQLHHVGPHQKRVPRWMWTLVIDFLAPLVCLCHVSQRYRYLGAKLSKAQGHGTAASGYTISSGSVSTAGHAAAVAGGAASRSSGRQDEFRMSTLSRETLSSSGATEPAGGVGASGSGGWGSRGEVWSRGRGACNGIILRGGDGGGMDVVSLPGGGGGGGGGVGGAGVADKAYRRVVRSSPEDKGMGRMQRNDANPPYGDAVGRGGGGGGGGGRMAPHGNDRGSYVSAATTASSATSSSSPSSSSAPRSSSPAASSSLAPAAASSSSSSSHTHVHGRAPSPARRDSHKRPGEFLNAARSRGGRSSGRGGSGGSGGGGGGGGRGPGDPPGSGGDSPLSKGQPATPPGDGSVSPALSTAGRSDGGGRGGAADTDKLNGAEDGTARRAAVHGDRDTGGSGGAGGGGGGGGGVPEHPAMSSGGGHPEQQLPPGDVMYPRLQGVGGPQRAGAGSETGAVHGNLPPITVALPAVKFSGAGSEPALPSLSPPPSAQHSRGDAPPSYQSWQAHQHPPLAAGRDCHAPPPPAGQDFEPSSGHVRQDTQNERITQHLQVLVSRDDEDEYHQDVVTEWRVIAHVMDRLLFWLFLIVAIVSSVIILIVKPLTKPEKWKNE